jgi:hypothetical protein
VSMSEHGGGPVDYEKKDVDTEGVLHVGAVVIVATIVASVLVLFLFNFMVDQARKADPANPPLARHEQGRKPPEPRLQEMPFKDITLLRAEERELLDASGWVDEPAGIARIPIAQAMKIVAEKGLPRWAAAPQASPSPAPAKGAK